MFKIGNIEIKNKIILAPMAGVTNSAYRIIAKDFEPGYVCTEMTSNVGFKYNSAKTKDIAKVSENEGIVALQIFGGDVEDYVEAAKYYDKNSNAKIIDINMGCPVKKVAIKSQAGSALIKTPEKVREIVSKITATINKPLTVKIRLGWDEKSSNYMDIAKIIEESGAAALIVHGRTREQMYQGKANWDAIKEIKESLSIPVIGNGDVFTPEDAKKMLDYTGVDAVMVARAAQTSPWVIKQMNDYIKTGKYGPNPTIDIIYKTLNRYMNILLEEWSESYTLAQSKSVSSQWFAGFKGANDERRAFMTTKDLSIFRVNLAKFVEKLKEKYEK
ncbi:tRNA dihydrouridine synthase DusB [Mycoplasma marinum]|uniref:tRNA-dihydrouridine synthase n=1 Tax=Mycoplasma marinum TaxID=1937190 RepID=A0A4V2NHW9_9MOLU|nr:tRNA dihydrouridine synthase DusB [Mycoplasma marinum]TCG10458.1 tRNA dihydrouridine synthase DusB [Mycoplasma marinum]